MPNGSWIYTVLCFIFSDVHMLPVFQTNRVVTSMVLFVFILLSFFGLQYDMQPVYALNIILHAWFTRTVCIRAPMRTNICVCVYQDHDWSLAIVLRFVPLPIRMCCEIIKTVLNSRQWTKHFKQIKR